MSDEQKRGPGRPPKITVHPRSDESTWSPEDIIRARLEGENIFGHTNDNSLPLKDRARWHQRIFNNMSNPSQVHAAQRKLGWVPIRLDDLEDGITPESLGMTVAPDGTIRRGARDHEEVFMKMDEASYQAVQKKKAAENVKGMSSEKAARDDAANAAAAAHGDQAGDYIAKHTSISIKDSQQILG